MTTERAITDVFDQCDDCGGITHADASHQCPTRTRPNTGRKTAAERERLCGLDDGDAADWVAVSVARGESPAYHAPTDACLTCARYAQAASAHPATHRTDLTATTDDWAIESVGVDAAVPLVPADDATLGDAITDVAQTVVVPASSVDRPSALVDCHSTFGRDVVLVERGVAQRRGHYPCQKCFDLEVGEDE